FFFSSRRRHTRSKRDWSSDVCSSDLARNAAEKRPQREEANRGREHPACAEAIGHPAADRNKHRQAQRVTRQHSLHAERGDGERRSEERRVGKEGRAGGGLEDERECAE